jgi:hypothetical protein
MRTSDELGEPLAKEWANKIAGEAQAWRNRRTRHPKFRAMAFKSCGLPSGGLLPHRRQAPTDPEAPIRYQRKSDDSNVGTTATDSN